MLGEGVEWMGASCGDCEGIGVMLTWRRRSRKGLCYVYLGGGGGAGVVGGAGYWRVLRQCVMVFYRDLVR